jgi:hypothetical protein
VLKEKDEGGRWEKMMKKKKRRRRRRERRRNKCGVTAAEWNIGSGKTVLLGTAS